MKAPSLLENQNKNSCLAFREETAGGGAATASWTLSCSFAGPPPAFVLTILRRLSALADGLRRLETVPPRPLRPPFPPRRARRRAGPRGLRPAPAWRRSLPDRRQPGRGRRRRAGGPDRRRHAGLQRGRGPGHRGPARRLPVGGAHRLARMPFLPPQRLDRSQLLDSAAGNGVARADAGELGASMGASSTASAGSAPTRRPATWRISAAAGASCTAIWSCSTPTAS